MGLDVAALAGVQVAVLVEGTSDQAAVETLAERRGLALADAGVRILPMGGATNIARFVRLLGPRGLGIRLAGLCDAAEAGYFSRALARAGLIHAMPSPGPVTLAQLEALGFFVCDPDLEGELIRAHGIDSVERLIDSQRELGSFRTFQKQPAQQGRSPELQLHRFLGTRSGRKRDYARLLAATIALNRVPRPLAALIARL